MTDPTPGVDRDVEALLARIRHGITRGGITAGTLGEHVAREARDLTRRRPDIDPAAVSGWLAAAVAQIRTEHGWTRHTYLVGRVDTRPLTAAPTADPTPTPPTTTPVAPSGGIAALADGNS